MAKAKRDMVRIKLFRDNHAYREDVFVSVNGENFQIQRGVEGEVPRDVARVLDNSARQDRYTASLIQQLEDQYLQDNG